MYENSQYATASKLVWKHVSMCVCTACEYANSIQLDIYLNIQVIMKNECMY